MKWEVLKRALVYNFVHEHARNLKLPDHQLVLARRAAYGDRLERCESGIKEMQAKRRPNLLVVNQNPAEICRIPKDETAAYESEVLRLQIAYSDWNGVLVYPHTRLFFLGTHFTIIARSVSSMYLSFNFPPIPLHQQFAQIIYQTCDKPNYPTLACLARSILKTRALPNSSLSL